MTQTIRERIALQDEANRRALSQRLLRAGQEQSPEEVEEHRRKLVESVTRTTQAANESDAEALRSSSSLGGLLLAVAFAILCVYAGTIALDWATDGAVWDIPVPAKIGSVG